MTKLNVGFKRLEEGATLPLRSHSTDSGFDLYANEDVLIFPEESLIIKTDIAVLLPEGTEAQIRPRSGLTAKTPLRVQLGTIDNGYTGELGVIVDNTAINYVEVAEVIPIGEDERPIPRLEILTTKEVELLNGDYEINPYEVPEGTYRIRKGDRIAQLVVQELPKVEVYEVTEDLNEGERGSNGFGSTGVSE